MSGLRAWVGIASLSVVLLISGCGGGSSSSSSGTLIAPTAAAIRAAIAAVNPGGMLPSEAWSAVTIPACTLADGTAPSFTVGYTVVTLPTWLTFDATTRTIALSGVAAVPQDADAPVSLTYACANAADLSVNASQTLVINDLDGGGATDSQEHAQSAAPLLSSYSAVKLTATTAPLYRVAAGTGFRIPTTFPASYVGFNLADPADEALDPDADTLLSSAELLAGTNPFVATSTGGVGAIATMPSGPVVGPGEQSGDSPFAAVAEDFNGDGKLDLAFANTIGQSATLFWGRGDGTFADGVVIATSYAKSQNLRALAAADLDNDGDIDLAAAVGGSGADGSIHILFNDGAGNFTPHVYIEGELPTINGNRQPLDIIAVDITADGNVDLIAAGAGADSLYILTGDGSGNFTVSTIAVGESSQAVTAGDWNEDGLMDLASTNKDSDSVSVLLGHGDGTFDAPTTIAVGDLPVMIVTADLNADGHLDLVTTNLQSNHLSLLFGDGTGGFTPQTALATENYPWSVKVADLDGDGDMDLAVTHWFGLGSASENALIYLNNGDGTFVTPQSYALGGDSTALILGDFNGDAALDLACSPTAFNIGILLNTK